MINYLEIIITIYIIYLKGNNYYNINNLMLVILFITWYYDKEHF